MKNASFLYYYNFAISKMLKKHELFARYTYKLLNALSILITRLKNPFNRLYMVSCNVHATLQLTRLLFKEKDATSRNGF